MPKNGWVFYFLMLPHFPVLGFTLFHFRMKNHNFHQMLHEPVRLNLRRYRGIQKIWKSYRWTRICKFSRQKCRIYKFSRQKCRIYKFLRQKLRFWTTWQNPVFGSNFVCSGWDQSIDSSSVKLIANLFYWKPICFIDSPFVLSIAKQFYW